MHEKIITLHNHKLSLTGDLTTAQVAIAMGKSRRTIQRLIQNGELEGYKVNTIQGPSWRIKPLSVLKAIELEELQLEHTENLNSKSAEDALIEMLYEKIDQLEKKVTLTPCSCNLEKVTCVGVSDGTVELNEVVIKDTIAVEEKYPHLNWWGKLCSTLLLSFSFLQMPARHKNLA